MATSSYRRGIAGSGSRGGNHQGGNGRARDSHALFASEVVVCFDKNEKEAMSSNVGLNQSVTDVFSQNQTHTRLHQHRGIV